MKWVSVLGGGDDAVVSVLREFGNSIGTAFSDKR